MKSVLTGSIHFSDGGGTFTITDAVLIPNSVSVTMSTCRQNKFDIGTFNAAMLKMGVIDSQANNRNYAGATVDLSISVTDDEDQTTSYDLGEYYVDGTTVKRSRNKVTFTAQDKSLVFNVEIGDTAKTATYTALTALQAACTAVGVYFANSAGLSGFVNTDVSFTLANKQIQTWRDAVMWVCQLIGGNAILDRGAALAILPAKYGQVVAHTIGASQRADISFSDKRLYVKYLTAYCGNNVKTYSTDYEPPDEQKQQAELTLEYNPLLAGKSETDCDTINNAILNYLSGRGAVFLQRQITAKLFESPQIGLGLLIDFTGGKIDAPGRTTIKGYTTYIVWRYHGYTTVTCTAPNPVYETTGESEGGDE